LFFRFSSTIYERLGMKIIYLTPKFHNGNMNNISSLHFRCLLLYAY
jgi:hypothetical protein